MAHVTQAKRDRWQFWVDRGGTFTDIVARAPGGALSTLKLLSEDSAHYEDATVAGIRRILGLRDGEMISSAEVESVKMGTTVATNALLERRGEPTVLVTTRGFRDALRIATQARPRLFARHIVLPELLYASVIEADERVDASGGVITPLDAAALQGALERARLAGLSACAIVFLHAYRAPLHELEAEAWARRAGFTQISVSHRVSPLMKLVPRGDTTVVDAYLSPILRRYVERVAAHMPGVRLLFMQSSGGLTEAGHFQGKDAILSGPAGGIVGMAESARTAGHARLIGFDMGGTSTDVSHYAGEYERVFDTQVAGVRVRAPMMSIHSIAAGGGSIIRFDGSRLRVGPESAGADPGPACYRRGGPLTVTDANLLLGRIHPEHFPKVFGPDGRQPLDRARVELRFGELAQRMSARAGFDIGREEAAAGALRIAVGSMANAIKRISVARGYDVTRYTLQCFGGAGGQHACQVADALGIEHIFCHPLAGVLSALGMGLADQIAMRQATLERVMSSAGIAEARRLGERLAQEAAAALAAQGVPLERVRRKVRLMVCYQGTDTALRCELPARDDVAAIRAEFETLYLCRFAFLMRDLDLVIESVTVECVGVGESVQASYGPTERPAAKPTSSGLGVDMYCAADDQPAGWRRGLLMDGEGLEQGISIEGPAIIAQRNATIVVEPGWRALVTVLGNLELTRGRARAALPTLGGEADPVLLEVFNNLFMNVAEQMGLALQNTAHSVNIKERLDFSCAVFDARGDLIANAPHMPVHLGSMGESIRSIIEANPKLAPGEAYMLNDPYRGGTHLPDITVVTPVFLDAMSAPSFFVASRGHHADVGGTTPGSMPPFSTSIEEEGVLIDNLKVLEAGQLNEPRILDLLTRGPYPARSPAQNLADLRAQIAANEKGAAELRAMVGQFGADTVARYMHHAQGNAEECVRRVITALRDGKFTLDARQWSAYLRRRERGCRKAQRAHRFHRHQRAAGQQLQRAARHHGGRGPVRLSHAGR